MYKLHPAMYPFKILDKYHNFILSSLMIAQLDVIVDCLGAYRGEGRIMLNFYFHLVWHR